MKRLLFILLFLAGCGEPAAERRPVLFIGLDGADWQRLDPLMESGAMPNLAALAREGRTGVLTTIQPPLSPLVWTTMMTGVSPLEHGILDFTRLDPATGAEEPITREERRVPAVWNLGDRSVAVLGMWATWPAEPVKGLMVADRFFSFTSRESRPPPGIVHPPEREAWARETLRRIERETGYDAVKAYFPGLQRSELQERPDPYAHPVSALRRILIETRAYDALARSWLEEQTPDLTILYFQGTDTIGHVFAPLAERRVPDLYFAEVDRLLGWYREWAEEHGAVLMLASDHGFLWDEGQPAGPMTAATAGRWHRDQGMYLLWGPGIELGERQRGRVDQVCATLLSLLGLPPGKRMAGPPLPGAPGFQGEPVDYPWRPAPVPEVETASGEEEVAKLRALGYLDSGNQVPKGETRTAASYNNQGLLLRQEGRTDQAMRAFERALEIAPGSASALWNLSDLLSSTDPARSDDLLVRALEAGLHDGVQRVLERARTRPGLLDRAIAVRPNEAKLRLARGQVRFERRDCAAALADFEEAARLSSAEPLAYNGTGIARLCLGDPEGAAGAFRRSLEIDPAQPEIRQALAGLPD